MKSSYLRSLPALALALSLLSSPVLAQGPASGTVAGKDPQTKGTASKNDHALEQAVSTRLGKSLGFDTARLAVRARNGSVTLSGSVPTADEKEQAERVVRDTPGVVSVINKLKVLHGARS